MAFSLDDALATFSGFDGPWFKARYQRAEALWAVLAGSEGYEALEAQAVRDGGQAPHRHRGQPARLLDEGFEDLTDGFFESWADLMAEEVWIPSGGQLMRVASAVVRKRLEAISDEPPALSVSDVRLYDTRDLRSRWPAPLPAYLELIAGGQRALLRAATYSDDDDTFGRCCTLFTVEDQRPVMQAPLLPAFDESLIGHAARSTDEHEGARVLDSMVRAICLGHAGTVQLNQNRIMERIIFSEDVVDFPALVQRTLERRNASAVRWVFGETQRMTDQDSSPLYRAVMKQSKKVWLRKPETFKPVGFSMRLQFLDNSGTLTSMPGAEGVALRIFERDGKGDDNERWRLGALSIPDLPSK